MRSSPGALPTAQVWQNSTMTASSPLAPTSQKVIDADALQEELREGVSWGPTYDEQSTLSSRDIRNDGRWPNWGPAVADLGVAAVVSVRLYRAPDNASGALNLFYGHPREVTSNELVRTQIAASSVSIELARQRGRLELWEFIDVRHVIGQAQGVLMQRHSVDADDAFTVLERCSVDLGVRIARVADALVRTMDDKLPAAHPDDASPDRAS